MHPCTRILWPASSTFYLFPFSLSRVSTPLFFFSPCKLSDTTTYSLSRKYWKRVWTSGPRYFRRIDSFWKYLKLGRFVVRVGVELDKALGSIASYYRPRKEWTREGYTARNEEANRWRRRWWCRRDKEKKTTDRGKRGCVGRRGCTSETIRGEKERDKLDHSWNERKRTR